MSEIEKDDDAELEGDLDPDEEIDLGDDDDLDSADLDENGDDEIDALLDESSVNDPPTEARARSKARARSGVDTGAEDEDEDDVLDMDEELHPDDVEEALDVQIKERIASTPLEDEEEDIEDELDEVADAEVDAEDRLDGGGRVVPKRPGEFVCTSCFLVKHPGQLADKKRVLCRDCV